MKCSTCKHIDSRGYCKKDISLNANLLVIHEPACRYYDVRLNSLYKPKNKKRLQGNKKKKFDNI